MARALTFFTAALAALALASPAAPQSGSATLMIRHLTKGCHSWSLNAGPLKAVQSVSLAKGATLIVVDNDVMAHKLIKTSGPSVKMTKIGSAMRDMSHEFSGAGVMAHMGATIAVQFNTAGTYTFTTKAGEDYMKGIKTIGEDHVLKLTVKVT
ncbi:MAG: hypothetical protein ACYDA3_12985 [Gaiellaceae bacterium]